MTSAEFIANEVPSFQPGELIVVSGPDLAAIYLLLMDARDALPLAYRLDPIDTRATVQYASGVVSDKVIPTVNRFGAPLRTSFEYPGHQLKFLSGANINQTRVISDWQPDAQAIVLETDLPSVPAIGDSFSIEPNPERAYQFEYLAMRHRAAGAEPKVVLIGNQFDINNDRQNPFPNTLISDVVRDLISTYNVAPFPLDSGHLNYAGTRELFLYIKRIYHYDGTTVTYITNQQPERP